jgi:hypothetical protein
MFLKTKANNLQRNFLFMLQSNYGNLGYTAPTGTFTPGVRDKQGSGTGSGTGSVTGRGTESQPDMGRVLDAESDDESNNRPPPPSPLPHSLLPTHPSMVLESSGRDSNISQKKVLIDKGNRGFQRGKINEKNLGDKGDNGDDGVDDMGHEFLMEPSVRHQERGLGGKRGDGVGTGIGTGIGTETGRTIRAGAVTGAVTGSGAGVAVTAGLDEDKNQRNKTSSEQSLQSLKKQQKSRQEQEQTRRKGFQTTVDVDLKVTPPLSGLATPGLNNSKVRTEG